MGGTLGDDSSSAEIASKSNTAWIPESIMNVKQDIFKANFSSWPASTKTKKTWDAVYHIRRYDRDLPLLARFSDPKTKPSTFRRFIVQCLN